MIQYVKDVHISVEHFSTVFPLQIWRKWNLNRPKRCQNRLKYLNWIFSLSHIYTYTQTHSHFGYQFIGNVFFNIILSQFLEIRKKHWTEMARTNSLNENECFLWQHMSNPTSPTSRNHSYPCSNIGFILFGISILPTLTLLHTDEPFHLQYSFIIYIS